MRVSGYIDIYDRVSGRINVYVYNFLSK